MNDDKFINGHRVVLVDTSKFIEDMIPSSCKKNCKTIEDINNSFNADDVCMKCENIEYNNGVISCKYSKV